jgi:hypothetical protein
MKATEARLNAYDTARHEIDDIESAIKAASNEGKMRMKAPYPIGTAAIIESYLRNNGFEVTAMGGGNDVVLEISWT